MSQESFNSEASSSTTTTSTTGQDPSSQPSPTDHSEKIQSAIQSLSSITPIPPSILSSQNPAYELLHDTQVSVQVSSLLRHPDSGAGDNQLCRWFYDTFQANAPQFELLVLRFLPIITGLYLSRIPQRKPLAGFEAVLLALYAYESTTRNGQAVTVNILNLTNSSIYHETKDSRKNMSSELNIAVISPTLEPHGTVRSTRRARIVGVALELYFSKIASIPSDSKLDFCEFCVLWAGQNGDMYKEEDNIIYEKKDSETEKQEKDSEKEKQNDNAVISEVKDSEQEKQQNAVIFEEKDSENEKTKDAVMSEEKDTEHEKDKKDVVNVVSEGKDSEEEKQKDIVAISEEKSVEDEKGKEVVISEEKDSELEKRKEEVPIPKEERKEGRIHLPWELMQPVLRILSHCLMGPEKDEKLFEAASGACRSLYARSLHDINAKAILATGSLLRLIKLAKTTEHNEIDYTEIQFTSVISI